MRIMIAVPTFENIALETFKSIYDLFPMDNDVSFEYVRGYDCAIARNKIASKAVDEGYDAVLMVDSDIILPPESLMWFQQYLADICLGVYPRKGTTTGEMEAFKLGQYNYVDRFTREEVEQSGDRFQIKGGGFGAAFINVDVFRNLPYPWFQYVNYDNGSVLSEDLYFCSQASGQGYQIWADRRVRCGHIMKHVLY